MERPIELLKKKLAELKTEREERLPLVEACAIEDELTPMIEEYKYVIRIIETYA